MVKGPQSLQNSRPVKIHSPYDVGHWLTPFLQLLLDTEIEISCDYHLYPNAG